MERGDEENHSERGAKRRPAKRRMTSDAVTSMPANAAALMSASPCRTSTSSNPSLKRQRGRHVLESGNGADLGPNP